jgi:hypothetical protein
MRSLSRLSALFVARAKDPGMYADGGGLYLQVSRTGTKSWIFRYALDGREREMGLGPLHTITLAEARNLAMETRRLKLSGIDPIDARKAERQAKRLEDARAISFKQASAAYIKSNKSAWKNPKHAAQWESTLTTYADPIFGSLPVAAIDTALVMKALEAIWSENPYWIGPRRADTARARIPQDGAATSTRCCPPARRCRLSSTMPLCPIAIFQPSCRPSVARLASVPLLWNSPS